MDAPVAIPEAGSGLDEAFRLLRHSRTTAARLEERRSSLGVRTGELTKQVALAKGRLLLKPDVDECLERMQAESASRTVGSFETLLSAFVSEVLPQAKPIGLQLTTERGQPALDISSMSANGTAIDIFEDDGGALTNVVVSALRLLAVVKAKGAKFIALDEPDHWIKADRVPFFYHVFEEAARRLGIQCFAISHWDVRTFDTSMHISTIFGDPKDRCEITSDKPAPEWPDDDAPGFRYVRLKNVQTLRDAEIDFGPGVNALTGDNGLGKSSLIRVFRAAFYGETRDGLISLGERGMEVEFGWSQRRFLRFTREIKRNPKDIWSYHEEDGTLVSQDYHTGGRTVPEWVNEIFGLGRQGPIDIHISHQKKPLFLLEAAGSVRASILSVGREADYVADAMQIHKEQVKKDKEAVRDGEKELADIKETLQRLEATTGLTATVEALEGELDDLTTAIRTAGSRRASLRGFAAIVDALATVRSMLDLLEQLPERAQVELLAGERRRLIADAGRLRDAIRLRDALGTATSMVDAASNLPTTVPRLKDTEPGRILADRTTRISHALAARTAEAAVLVALPTSPPALKDTRPGRILVVQTTRIRESLASISDEAAALATLPASPPTLKPIGPMRQAMARLTANRTQLAEAMQQCSILGNLPETRPALADVSVLRRMAATLAVAAKSAEGAKTRAALLEELPAPPVLGGPSPLSDALSLLKRSAKAVDDAGKQVTAARARETTARRRIDALVAAGGGRCPTCGQSIDADTLLSAAHPHH